MPENLYTIDVLWEIRSIRTGIPKGGVPRFWHLAWRDACSGQAKRDKAKKLLVQGVDPKAEQKEAQAENSGAYTFETIAREWHVSNKRWSENHRLRVLHCLLHALRAQHVFWPKPYLIRQKTVRNAYSDDVY